MRGLFYVPRINGCGFFTHLFKQLLTSLNRCLYYSHRTTQREQQMTDDFFALTAADIPALMVAVLILLVIAG
jgi:hypothetical protein